MPLLLIKQEFLLLERTPIYLPPPPISIDSSIAISRALIPIKAENVLIAGRTMSSDNIAFAATRNTVCCLITGQAAGSAAAISVLENVTPREVDIKQLQDYLTQNNVLLKPKPDPLDNLR